MKNQATLSARFNRRIYYDLFRVYRVSPQFLYIQLFFYLYTFNLWNNYVNPVQKTQSTERNLSDRVHRKSSKTILENKDILGIAQSIVSKSIGRIRDISEITPSEKAIELYQQIKVKAEKLGIPVKSPELIQAILDESKKIIKVEHVLIVETKNQGFICANAGIDQSNVEGENIVTLLPEKPDNEAKKIRNELKELTNLEIAVIISDSFGRPFRIGSTGVAIGIAGMNPILDQRGFKDLYGYTLQTTIIGHADNLVSAAQLVMGESNEGIPVVIIRGYDYKIEENASIVPILREPNLDLFRSEE